MIVLDTHVLIWWVDVPNKLSKKARKAIEEEKFKKGILISSISVFEINILVKKNKLELISNPGAWLGKIESLPFIKFIPVDNKIAADSVNLPDFYHKDPADRIIIATALNEGVKLITADKKILNYPLVQSIW